MPIEIESKPNNLAQSQVLPSIPEQEEKEKFGNTIFDIWKSR